MSCQAVPLLRWLSLLVLFVMAAGPVRAQKPVELRYPIPEKVERATKADDQGVLQWTKWEEPQCPTCKGTGKTKCPHCWRFPDDVKDCIECKRTAEREAVCRVCAGLGHIADPLEKVLCPGCLGAGFEPCMTCGGGGQQKVNGNGDTWTACVSCRGTGGYKCGVCEGERLVEPTALKPTLGEANAATLKKAIATTDQILAGLSTWEPTGKNSRKEAKEFTKILGPAAALMPPLKRMPKVFDTYMGKLYAGNQFVGYEENQANGMKLWKEHTTYYLKLQKRMMELCLKRAEANAEHAEATKGK